MKKIINSIKNIFYKTAYIFKAVTGIPLVGEFKGRFLVEPPKLRTKKFGKAGRTPTILEIKIDEKHHWPLKAGSFVKEAFFKDYPPIVFNVCFSCSRPNILRVSDYANPESHWFNVFMGFYEIDVPKSEWQRPFGFKDSTKTDIEFSDLLRIGKSDWNYFSNYIYGVPVKICKKYDNLNDKNLIERIIDKNHMINGKSFVEAEVEGISVVSGYVSDKDGNKLLNNNKILSPVWRFVFGRSKSSENYPDSFIPCRMKMRFLLRYEEGWDEDLGEEAFRTFIYGGTVNMDYKGPLDNEEFLNAQMEAVKYAIKIKDLN